MTTIPKPEHKSGLRIVKSAPKVEGEFDEIDPAALFDSYQSEEESAEALHEEIMGNRKAQINN